MSESPEWLTCKPFSESLARAAVSGVADFAFPSLSAPGGADQPGPAKSTVPTRAAEKTPLRSDPAMGRVPRRDEGVCSPLSARSRGRSSRGAAARLDRPRERADSGEQTPSSLRGTRPMAGSLRSGVFSAALVGTVLFAGPGWSAPPGADKEGKAKSATPETAARAKLSEKGLHVSHSGLSLIDEKELAKAFAEANTLKRKLVAAAKEQQAVELEIQ